MNRPTHRPSPPALAAMIGLFACSEGKGPDCGAYANALATCLSEAEVPYTVDDLAANACEAQPGEPYPAYFDCVTEALEGADCSSTEGIRAASAATAPCRALLTFMPVEEGYAGEAPVAAERR